MVSVEERLQKLEEEAAIRDVAARFADSVTRDDQQTIVSLFTSNGVLSILEPYAFSAQGEQEIASMVRKLRSGKDFFVHFVHSGLIQIVGDKASARWLIREMAIGRTTNNESRSFYNVFVFATDELVRQNGRWLISTRTFSYIFTDTKPFSGEAVPIKLTIDFA